MSYNPQNERIKARYEFVIRENEGLAESTIRHRMNAISRYEEANGWEDFKRFTGKKATAFRRTLMESGGKRAGELSSRATVHATLMHLRAFFRWLSTETGYRKAINSNDADFFKLSRRDGRIAMHRSEKVVPPMADIEQALANMPSGTAIEKRNRGLVALTVLTGIRIKALITLKVKHVRADKSGIDQYAGEVHTKFSKSYPVFFMPVRMNALEIFQDYVEFLKTELGFRGDDPLFPSTKQSVGVARQFRVEGLEKCHWVTPDPVRDIFKAAYAAVALPYYTPHTVRNALVDLGQRLCRTPEEFKAWSQNMGHEDTLTTMRSYGWVTANRQQQIVQHLGTRDVSDLSTQELMDELAKRLK